MEEMKSSFLVSNYRFLHKLRMTVMPLSGKRVSDTTAFSPFAKVRGEVKTANQQKQYANCHLRS